MQLERVLDFMRLTHAFQRIERRLNRPGDDRLENDAEHSYQLAMMAWFLNNAEDLHMDTGLLLAYALVHDLVEVHAGDTFAYSSNQNDHDTKAAREAAAAEQLAKDFPEFPELMATIHAYESRADRESRFIYTLDKFLPSANNYLDGGRTWHREGITLDMMKGYKTDKIAEVPEVNKHFMALLERIEEDPGLFPRTLAD